MHTIPGIELFSNAKTKNLYTLTQQQKYTKAFTVDFLVYPLDTIKTRVQSPDYRRFYTTNGAINRSLFRGLYQGIGSVILATLPSCI
ncbi:MAG: hypothetical protein LQ346_006297 [Caloplaca aetnensis]|nr:MAG: hypothetical protein LQ346_006297 [Caloplaca aetnensis]